MDGRRVREIHRRFGTPDALLSRRRALYSAVLELRTGRSPGDDPDLLDSPLVRHRVGEVLAGREPGSPTGPERLSDVTAVPAPGVPPLVVDATVTAGLREIVRRGLGDDAAPLRPLGPGDPGFDAAAAGVVEGVRTARRLCPELADDILPHVAAFAVVAAGTGRLGSASAREYPGLVVVPEPATPFEVAEALVHEGAHQKLFDLGVTCALLTPATFDAPGIRPSWRAGTVWPVEQALAACHAYRCLAALEIAVRRAPEPVRVHEHSLLGAASARADELGAALDRRRDRLGPDGRLLVDLLRSRDGAREVPSGPPPRPPGEVAVTRHCGDRMLLVHRGDPVTLRWEPLPAG